jgi:UTP--glucose-1-phosphate uridylyltransferase
MKAVIPAAGLGTRCLPATKSMPKEMLPVVDRPVIQYVVEEAVASGCDQILIVTGRGKRSIEDHFDKSFELEHHLAEDGKHDVLDEVQAISDLARVHYVRQPEPEGLGDAILCAREFVGKDPFAVLLGDDIMVNDVRPTQQLANAYEDTGNAAISVMPVEREGIQNYGAIDPEPVDDTKHRVQDMVEKPDPDEAPSQLASIGRYVFEPSIFNALDAIEPGHGGELQLTDAIAHLARRDPVYAVPYHGERLDVGSTEGFLKANLRLASRDKNLRKALDSEIERWKAGESQN